jgi:hypothetical protein
MQGIFKWRVTSRDQIVLLWLFWKWYTKYSDPSGILSSSISSFFASPIFLNPFSESFLWLHYPDHMLTIWVWLIPRPDSSEIRKLELILSFG